MAKLCLLVLCVGLVAVFAEPPPPSYLPPQGRNTPSSQYGAPSQQYGAPQQRFGGQQSSGRSYSYNSLAENQFGGSSRSSSRGRAGPAPRQQYSAPSARQQPSQQYGAPSFDDSAVVGAARSSQGRRNGFSAPRPFAPQPASQYNAPAPRQQSSYAAAARQQPSAQYGAPSAQYGAPSSQYGAPFGRSNMDDDLAEPANYEYNYEVNAAEESGAEFGHQETREDDFAQGEYHVLLPDGRMQIVEYEADEEGFRPKIRYEETGYPDARDNQGPY